ncbi:MAG: helix-turn-helix transcriptional regulator [Micropruina sp.]|nr:helix-turn-helix transcriptional regulator [Micropruina sp.]
MPTLSLSLRHNPDPLTCDDFGYGIGTIGGVLVLRYAVAGDTVLSDRRDDLLHQLFWSPDCTLEVSDQYGTDARITADRAYWVHQVSSNLVRARGEGAVYRVCLRQVPRPIGQLRTGVVRIDEEAVRHLTLLGSGAVRDDEWRRSRELMMDGLSPVDVPPDPRQPVRPPGGVAAEVARVILRDPSDDRNLTEWASELHVSTKTLQRDFDRVFGMPFTAWRTRTRLSAARDLLDVAPVGEVARRVGYASTSAFVAAFARAFGSTPTAMSRGAEPARGRAEPQLPAPARRRHRNGVHRP